MAPLKSLSLWWIWLAVTVLCSADSQGQKIITAESGQNTTLTCRAPDNNNNIIVVEWSRADLGKEYVLMYRGGRFVPDDQHPFFKNRVDLQDRQMKDGDVSLILKNVTINDAGKYECRVVMRRTNRGKRAYLNTDPITTISLNVAPGQTGGQSGDGEKKDEGDKSAPVGLIVGLPVLAVLVIVAVGVGAVFIYRTYRRRQNPDYQPPEDQGL
ncbi:V-set domain containing T-cell activation inhibitor 1 isoform X2 [Oreochromis niloticus]|uniref:V-set domain containing T-cell activation inhibitor 1 isoform X2 n=1 Tax=Oreochromis niloticus TaxID=8128 RepID=UPI0009054F28|nr:V-set domain containing T-cell activation inhibitor 1 isoform X2 [Oreochromis niloticus]